MMRATSAIGGGVADDELEDFAEVAGEDDEGEEGSAEEGVGGDFAEDVAGEDAHFFAAGEARFKCIAGLEKNEFCEATRG